MNDPQNTASAAIEFGGLTLALNIFGGVLKQIEKLPNDWIPAILFVAGGLGAGLAYGWSAYSVLEGIKISGTAIGIHQALIRTKDAVKPPTE